MTTLPPNLSFDSPRVVLGQADGGHRAPFVVSTATLNDHERIVASFPLSVVTARAGQNEVAVRGIDKQYKIDLTA